jgi:hypothetical protein
VQQIDQHWVFAAFCGVMLLLLVRLIVRERITLQSSLAFLGLLMALMTVAIFPGAAIWLATRMGFALPSNFLFAMGIAAMALLNVFTLMTLSRVELRSITLTQELGLLEEKLDRVARAQAAAAPGHEAREHPPQ